MALWNEMEIYGEGPPGPSQLGPSRAPAGSCWPLGRRTLPQSSWCISPNAAGVQQQVLLGGNSLALSLTHSMCPVYGSQGHSVPDL